MHSLPRSVAPRRSSPRPYTKFLCNRTGSKTRRWSPTPCSPNSQELDSRHQHRVVEVAAEVLSPKANEVIIASL
eukprot:6079188-Heterocapsa_arctica.AAC.2